MLYTLQNTDIICEIDTHGAELKSIKEKKTGREYLWNGDVKYWNRTSPVLFSFVGAVKDDKNAPFVCIEPWYGRCDKESYDGELSEREYEQKLGAEEEFNVSYKISF